MVAVAVRCSLLVLAWAKLALLVFPLRVKQEQLTAVLCLPERELPSQEHLLD
jgi:hypothetical protein